MTISSASPRQLARLQTASSSSPSPPLLTCILLRVEESDLRVQLEPTTQMLQSAGERRSAVAALQQLEPPRTASSSSPSLALPKGIRSRLEVSKSKVQLVSTTQKLQLMVVTLPAVSSRLPLEPLQTAFSSSPSPALLRDIQSRLEVLRSRVQLETIRLLLEVVTHSAVYVRLPPEPPRIVYASSPSPLPPTCTPSETGWIQPPHCWRTPESRVPRWTEVSHTWERCFDRAASVSHSRCPSPGRPDLAPRKIASSALSHSVRTWAVPR